MEFHPNKWKTTRLVKVALFAVIGIVLVSDSFTIVKSGTVAVRERLGKFDNTELKDGLHFTIPFVDTIHHVSVRQRSYDVKTDALSIDLQKVQANTSVLHSLEPSLVAELLRHVGDLEKLDKEVIEHAVEEGFKEVAALYRAANLVTRREEVTQKSVEAISNFIKETLKSKFPGIELAAAIGNVAVTNFSFETEFKTAVDETVQVEQHTLTAKNQKVQRQNDAITAYNEAKMQGDAQAFDILKQAQQRTAAIMREGLVLRQNRLALGLKAIEVWNGGLPQYIGKNVPATMLPLPPATK